MRRIFLMMLRVFADYHTVSFSSVALKKKIVNNIVTISKTTPAAEANPIRRLIKPYDRGRSLKLPWHAPGRLY